MSEIYLYIYIFLWAVALWVHIKRSGRYGAGGVLLSSYLFYAIVATVLYSDPIAIGLGLFNELKLFPFLYLFVMLLVASMPVLQYDKSKVEKISTPNMTVIYVFSLIYIIATIIQLPNTLTNMSDGIVTILTDQSGGAELYNEAHDSSNNSVFGEITNIFAIFHNLFSDIAIIVFFYLLSLKKQKKWILFGFSVAMIIDILYPLSRGLRTGATMKILTIVIAYFAMRLYLTDKLRKIAFRIGIVFLILLMTPFIMISISRFSEWEGGALYSIEYYIGQAPLRFNNNGLDAGGIRNGDRTSTLFKQLFYDNVPSTIMEGREKYPNLILDDSSFSTFVGDFTIDYGPIVAFFLFISFSLLVCWKSKVRGRIMRFHQLILVYFAMCVCMQGGMYLFNYAYGSNLVIIAFALFYLLVKYTSPVQVQS